MKISFYLKKVTLAFCFFLLICCTTTKKQSRTEDNSPHFSILQGLTWNQGAWISVVRLKTQKVSYHFLSSDENVGSSKVVKSYTLESSPWTIDHIQITFPAPLTPSPDRDTQSPQFIFQIQDPVTNQILDRRRVGTANLSKNSYKIIVVSCMDDRLEKDQDQIWHDVAQEQPDYLFMIGDNVYATTLLNSVLKTNVNAVNKEQLWERYIQTRQKLALFYLDQLIPTLAQWDDHDYGSNDGNKLNPHKEEAKEVFEAFFPQNTDVPGLFTHGPIHSTAFDAFQGRFYFLDNRYEREPKGQDQGQFAHLGTEQENWLMKEMAGSPKPTWLLEGDQFFGGYHKFESFEGDHPQSFIHFLSQLKKFHFPFLFVSGDRHLTEISRIAPPELNFETYEFTTSPIHANTYPSHWNTIPNPRQVVGADLNINYMIFEGENSPQQIHLKVTSKTKGKKILFSQDLHISPSINSSP